MPQAPFGVPPLAPCMTNRRCSTTLDLPPVAGAMDRAHKILPGHSQASTMPSRFSIFGSDFDKGISRGQYDRVISTKCEKREVRGSADFSKRCEGGGGFEIETVHFCFL